MSAHAPRPMCRAKLSGGVVCTSTHLVISSSMAMQGLFSVLAMIYPLMTYGANVEYSPHISNLVIARVYIVIYIIG